MELFLAIIIGIVCGGWIFIAAIVYFIKGRVENARSDDANPKWTAYDKMVDNGYDSGSGYDSGGGYDGGGDGGGC